MLCRVTPLGALIRKRTGATGSLPCRPRRTFSATRAQHTSHYETLSIPRNASKSQIKVSSTSPKTLTSVPHASPSLPITRYARTQLHQQNSQKKNPPMSHFLSFIFCVVGSMGWEHNAANMHKPLLYILSFRLVEQAVPSGRKQRSSSEGEVCSVQRSIRCSRR